MGYAWVIPAASAVYEKYRRLAPCRSRIALNGYGEMIMGEVITLFITWTSYGTWLPGDNRGWRKWKAGEQQPQPLLEKWCQDRLKEKPVLLNESQRKEVEDICRRHAEIRCWELHAISVRSNHVHIAITVNAEPKKVRDQFKANATRVLRQQPAPIGNEKVWTRGGDIQFIDDEDSLQQVILYITEAQDRINRT